MIKFKDIKRVLLFTFVASLFFAMAPLSEAAEISSIPDGAVINSQTTNAFHESQVGLSLISLEIVEAINAKKAVYFKLPGAGMFVNVTSGNSVKDSVIEALPELDYTDEKGIVSKIPGATQDSFEVISIE